MKKYMLGIIGLLACLNSFGQQTDIQPVPQEIRDFNQSISLPASYCLSGKSEANPHAVTQLTALLQGKETDNEGMQIYIGEKGDKAIRKFKSRIPKQAEGYYLRISEKEIVLAGNDERGTFYAIQTLRNLLKENKLPLVEIKDYPSVSFRGVVEGFYGTPWSHEARLRQLKFYGANKMNTYIYGPKDDPYHSCPNWRLPYPEKEAEQIKELIKVAQENEVNFVWAIHPGQDIQWNEKDRKNLLSKFEHMYQLGVRSFAVFFDDISGEGTNPVKQAELLNYIDEEFVKVKKDVTPLVMCPTEYNKSWSNPKGNYLTTLGEKLNKSIHIMWTGDRVISDISPEGIAWINERIKRPAYIWWNFPVSDYVRDHLLMGPVYGNDLHIASQMSGFVSNPMEHADASMIAIYGVASYTWNPEKYNSDKAWKAAIKTILPAAAEELEFFAAHSADLGQNGHRYRREESVALQPAAKAIKENYINKGHYNTEEFNEWSRVFERMMETSDILQAETSNKPLIDEMRPWLLQFKLIGQTGLETAKLVEALETDNQAAFLRKYKQIKSLQKQMFAVDQTYNQNMYQPGVKVASKVIKPLINDLFACATERFNQKNHTALDSKSDYMPHALQSNVNQLRNQPLQIKTNRVMVSPALEVIKWQSKGQLTVTLDKVYKGERIDLNLGKPNITWGVLEISADGKQWEKVSYEQEKNYIRTLLNKRPVKAIRFSNQSKQEQEIYLRQFIITIEK